MRIFKMSSLRTFQIYTTVVLIIVAMLYGASHDLYLVPGNFKHTSQATSFVHHPSYNLAKTQEMWLVRIALPLACASQSHLNVTRHCFL